MKKKVFAFMFFVCILLSGIPVVSANAGTVFDDYQDVNLISDYTVEILSSGKYKYTFTLIVESASPSEHGATLYSSGTLFYGYAGDDLDDADDFKIADIENDGVWNYKTASIDGVDTTIKTTVVITYESGKLYYDSSGHYNFLIKIRYSGSYLSASTRYVYFTLIGDAPEPAPTVTTAPTPTPSPIPEVTPDITPDVTPEITPEIKPESEPIVTLDVAVNGFDSVCTYYTGGMDSVSSCFDIQWYLYGKEYPDELSETVAEVRFVDGGGKYEYELKKGEWYRAVVTYTYYDSDGVKQIKEVYSDFFQGNDGGSPVVIWNLKSLLDWVWNELMEVEFTYEGFTVSFKQIFLFSLIAPTLILFIFYFVGMYGIGFLFGHHWSYSDKDDTISYSERDVIGSTARIEETYIQGDDFIMRK